MGGRVLTTGNHLCIDLTNVQMTWDEQQVLIDAVQETVVCPLARLSARANIVTISLLPGNNGQRQPEREPETPPEPATPSEPATPPDSTQK